jgi:16S rRNA (guanine527-N7)-methyltransferase
VIQRDGVEARLHEALGESRRLGFLGDRPIAEVVEHSRAFVDALRDVTGSVVDLGSGGGVPGLVLAIDRPDLAVTLLDRRTKRTDFLSRMVRRLGLDASVTVLATDIDDAIRTGHVGFDAAVARGFGPPEFTLRVALRCITPSGRIVISEPPSGDRWSDELIEELRLTRTSSDRRVVCFDRIVDSATSQ